MATNDIYLALDLGTTTGFAVGEDDLAMSGSWNLKPSRFQSSGMRFRTFRAHLDRFHENTHFTVVFYEEVRRHRGVDAAHIYGGLLGILQGWCEERNIPYCGVPVGQIKKTWSGSGNASKEMMIEEARNRGFDPKDDNEADALAILHWALINYTPAQAAGVSDAA